MPYIEREATATRCHTSAFYENLVQGQKEIQGTWNVERMKGAFFSDWPVWPWRSPFQHETRSPRPPRPMLISTSLTSSIKDERRPKKSVGFQFVLRQQKFSAIYLFIYFFARCVCSTSQQKLWRHKTRASKPRDQRGKNKNIPGEFFQTKISFVSSLRRGKLFCVNSGKGQYEGHILSLLPTADANEQPSFEAEMGHQRIQQPQSKGVQW